MQILFIYHITGISYFVELWRCDQGQGSDLASQIVQNYQVLKQRHQPTKTAANNKINKQWPIFLPFIVALISHRHIAALLQKLLHISRHRLLMIVGTSHPRHSIHARIARPSGRLDITGQVADAPHNHKNRNLT